MPGINKKKFVSTGAKKMIRDVNKLGLVATPPSKHGFIPTAKIGEIARSPQSYDGYVKSCEISFFKIMGKDWQRPDKETWRDAYDDELTPLEAAKYVAENEKAMAGIDDEDSTGEDD
jgi:hypothetical protein